MKKCFFITHEISDANKLEEFVDIITGSFISKKVKRNDYVVIAEDMSASKVYELISSKLSFDAKLMVIEFTHFYGIFINETVIDWLREQFPSWSWVEK